MSQKAKRLAEALSEANILSDLQNSISQIEQIAIQIGAVWPQDVVEACRSIGIQATIFPDEKYITSVVPLPLPGSNPTKTINEQGQRGGTDQNSDGEWNSHKK